MKKRKPIYKISFVGEQNVGKSSLRVCHYEPEKDIVSIPTTIAVQSHSYEIENFTLLIYDTAGQKRFESIIMPFVNHSHAVIFVFAHDDPISFKVVGNWLERHEYISVDNRYLVGNKSDLDSQIPERDIAEMILKYNLIYFSTSAKDDTNVANLFYKIESDIDDELDAFVLNNDFEEEVEMVDMLSYKQSCCERFSDFFRCI